MQKPIEGGLPAAENVEDRSAIGDKTAQYDVEKQRPDYIKEGYRQKSHNSTPKS
jgi:hypothetical protein